MATKFTDVLADRLPLIYSAVLILGITLIAQVVFKKDPLAGVPIAGAQYGGHSSRVQAYIKHSKSIYHEGYQKFKDTIYQISSPRSPHLVIVPQKFAPELKNLPDDVLSFAKAVEESMFSKYTMVKADEPAIPHVVKTSLTPGLVRLNPILTEEVARAVRSEMPPCRDWTEVNIHSVLLRIVAIVSGRIFLGPELCRDETYIAAAINYTAELMALRGAVMKMKPWQRWLYASGLPERKKLIEREDALHAVLFPIVKSRREAERTDPNWTKPDDMLQWLIDGSAKFGDRADKDLTKMQLGVSFAAIHTTVLTGCNAFYDLAAHPEFHPILREECAKVLADNGGVFTSPGLQSMKKVDSFMKESQRMHPPAWGSFERKVLKDIKLSNGQTIPAGTTLELGSYGVSRDPTPFPNPDAFDPMRFFNMRENHESFNAGGAKVAAVDSSAHNQFVSVSANSLMFGYGRHACPGRFFAANELKMILARFLLQYEFKNAGGEVGRTPNIEFGNGSIPNPRKVLLFKEIL